MESNHIPLSIATAKQEVSKNSKKKEEEKEFYSTGCLDPNDENEDVIITVTGVHLEIYWHKLITKSTVFSSEPLSEKSSRSQPSFSTNLTASLVEYSCSFCAPPL